MKEHRLLQVGALGAVLATLALVAMLFVPWPFAFSFPGEQFLAGKLTLSATDLASYVAIVQVCLAIDSVFVLAWVVAWLGFAALLRPRSTLLSYTALALGLGGALLDFAENEIVWALVQGRQWALAPQAAWLTGWAVVRQLSYRLTFAAASLVAIGLWSQKALDRVVSLAGTLLVALAIPGMYVPALATITGLWWLIWFGLGSLLLWRPARERAPVRQVAGALA